MRNVRVATVCAALALLGAAPPPANALASGCVATLKDVHTGSGDSFFASHYRVDSGWALGSWTAARIHGASLWHRAGDAWCKVIGGGTFDRRRLQGFGVPADVAGRLASSAGSPRHATR